MAKKNGFQKFVSQLIRFVDSVIEKLKKTDKRFLIMAAFAAVLFIVILSLLIHAVSAGKSKNKEDNSQPSSYIQEKGTEEATDDIVMNLGKTGKYTVNTGSESPLNLRPAANKDYGVLLKIPNGSTVDVLFVDDSSDTEWAYVDYNGTRGWVAMEYIKAQ